jgi:hypothetical protein
MMNIRWMVQLPLSTAAKPDDRVVTVTRSPALIFPSTLYSVISMPGEVLVAGWENVPLFRVKLISSTEPLPADGIIRILHSSNLISLSKAPNRIAYTSFDSWVQEWNAPVGVCVEDSPPPSPEFTTPTTPMHRSIPAIKNTASHNSLDSRLPASGGCGCSISSDLDRRTGLTRT